MANCENLPEGSHTSRRNGKFHGICSWFMIAQLMHRTTLVNCWGYKGDCSAIVNGVKKINLSPGEPHRQVPGCRIPVLLRQRIAIHIQVDKLRRILRKTTIFCGNFKKNKKSPSWMLRRFWGKLLNSMGAKNGTLFPLKLHEIGDSLLQFHLWLWLTSSHMDTRGPYVCIFSHKQIDRIV